MNEFEESELGFTIITVGEPGDKPIDDDEFEKYSFVEDDEYVEEDDLDWNDLYDDLDDWDREFRWDGDE